MAATTTDERTAIEAAIQLYIDGSSTGDVDKLREAFAEGVSMYGSLAGERVDIPVTELFKIVAETPLGSDVYEARITAVEQIGDAATVRLEEDGCWGTVSFVDWFALAKLDGEWKIVNKLFAHTGGEMPTG
jgi:putative lumazine-binding protein